MPTFVWTHRILEDDRRHTRHWRARIRIPILIVQRCEQQRGCLAADACQGQQNACCDAWQRSPETTLESSPSTEAPLARAQLSRIWLGTSCSISSVVRTTTGSTMNANAITPAHPEKCPVCRTTSSYTNSPNTIEGAERRMSFTNRIIAPILCRFTYSARCARSDPYRRTQQNGNHAHDQTSKQGVGQPTVGPGVASS